MDAPLALEAHGCAVELNAPATAIESARRLLPSNYAPASRSPDRSWRVAQSVAGWRVTEADDELACVEDLSLAVNVALSSLELWVAEHARDLIFLHAGCVELDGRAIVLPGYTLSGKTTLTAALVRAGARYLSDEYAILDTDGRVWPYARPLSLRDGSGRVARLAPEELGALAPQEPVPVGLFALLHYDPAGWSVQHLSRAHAIVALLTQTVPAKSRALEATAALERATEHALTLQGTRGDADEAAAALLAMLQDCSVG